MTGHEKVTVEFRVGDSTQRLRMEFESSVPGTAVGAAKQMGAWLSGTNRNLRVHEVRIIPAGAKALRSRNRLSPLMINAEPTTRPASRLVFRSRILATFRYFVSDATKADVDDVIGELKRDTREMRKKGHSERMIRAVIWWRSLACIGAIIGDGARRVAKRINPVLALFGREPTKPSS
ncbi:MAG: hypothetical protein IT459_23390 [Planctomycetes bacterium]|nr:hypothetical protein [Planctomycetota bacterium]